MKKLLRVLVTVLANLLTLPLQLEILAFMLVSERSDEENELIKENAVMNLRRAKKWIQTGKLIQTDEEEEEESE